MGLDSCRERGYLWPMGLQESSSINDMGLAVPAQGVKQSGSQWQLEQYARERQEESVMVHWNTGPLQTGPLSSVRTPGCDYCVNMVSAAAAPLPLTLKLLCQLTLYGFIIWMVHCDVFGMSLWTTCLDFTLTCVVSYHLFPHTAPLTCSPVVCNLRGQLGWEWNFISLINTQVLKREITAQKQGNWDVVHVWLCAFILWFINVMLVHVNLWGFKQLIMLRACLLLCFVCTFYLGDLLSDSSVAGPGSVLPSPSLSRFMPF